MFDHAQFLIAYLYETGSHTVFQIQLIKKVGIKDELVQNKMGNEISWQRETKLMSTLTIIS